MNEVLFAVTLREAFGWSLLIALAVGAIGQAVFWGVWIVLSVRRDRRDQAFQEATLANSREAADRTLALKADMERLWQVHRTVDEIKDHVTEALPLPPARPPAAGLSWLLAPAIVGLAVALSGAAVYVTQERQAMTTPAAAQAFDRAVGLQRSGQFVAAAAAYREAAAAGYDPVLALFGVAECQFYKRDDPAVVKTCEELLRTPGGAGRARFWLAHVFRRQGREDLARLEWEWSYKEGFAPAGMILAGTPHVGKESR